MKKKKKEQANSSKEQANSSKEQANSSKEQANSNKKAPMGQTRRSSPTAQDEEKTPPSDEEEGQMPKIRRGPIGPTKSEREIHEATHVPYRSWCRHCVRGRGRNAPHTRRGEEDEEIKNAKSQELAWTITS